MRGIAGIISVLLPTMLLMACNDDDSKNNNTDTGISVAGEWKLTHISDHIEAGQTHLIFYPLSEDELQNPGYIAIAKDGSTKWFDAGYGYYNPQLPLDGSTDESGNELVFLLFNNNTGHTHIYQYTILRHSSDELIVEMTYAWETGNTALNPNICFRYATEWPTGNEQPFEFDLATN